MSNDGIAFFGESESVDYIILWFAPVGVATAKGNFSTTGVCYFGGIEYAC